MPPKRRTKKTKKKTKKSAEKKKNEGTLEDFIVEVSKVMEAQAEENPQVARLHERLHPLFQEITDHIFQFIEAADEKREEEKIEDIIAYGEKSLLPLIEFIRQLKKQEEESTEP